MCVALNYQSLFLATKSEHVAKVINNIFEKFVFVHFVVWKKVKTLEHTYLISTKIQWHKILLSHILLAKVQP